MDCASIAMSFQLPSPMYDNNFHGDERVVYLSLLLRNQATDVPPTTYMGLVVGARFSSGNLLSASQ